MPRNKLVAEFYLLVHGWCKYWQLSWWKEAICLVPLSYGI